ncbi:ribosomal protein L1, partial [Ascobolus immersus RN42]
KASKALIKHLQSVQEKPAEKRNLLADEDEEDASPQNTVWLVLTTKKFIVDHNKLKPTRLPLPHPYIPATGTICLIVKDPQRAIKDLIPQLPLPLNNSVVKVIGLSKLKKKYKTFESRRLLRDSYDRFIVDDRVIPSLPAILGKTFYKSTTKTPLPIKIATDVTPVTLGKELHKALHSTYLRLSASASTSIRIGLKTQTPEEIAANVESVVNTLAEKVIPNGWRNIRSIYIKGTESVALPVWLVDEIYDKEKDARKEEPLAIEEKPVEKKVEEEKTEEKTEEKAAEPVKEKKAKAPKKEVKKSTYVEPPMEFAQPKKAAGKAKGGKAKKSSK